MTLGPSGTRLCGVYLNFWGLGFRSCVGYQALQHLPSGVRWTQASTSWPLCKTSVGLCWRIRGRSSSLNSGYPIKPLAGVTGFSVIVLLLGPQGFALGVAPKGTFGQNLHWEPFWLDTFRNRKQRCRSWSLQTRFYRCVTSGL